MPLQMFRRLFRITTATVGLIFMATVSAVHMYRARIMSMTLITPNYTAGGGLSCTISFIGHDGITYFTDSPRARNNTFQISIGSIVIESGDTIRATLSKNAGGIHDIMIILHLEE